MGIRITDAEELLIMARKHRRGGKQVMAVEYIIKLLEGKLKA